MIAALYKLRWQIELVFKQLKQNFFFKVLFRR
ncbi:transposase [Myroides odoratimimus]|nr:transposase [Myroides odoratimimus]